MNKAMSATEARVHFGDVLRRVRANETVVVEHGGKPEAVILSITEYERLRANQRDVEEPADWFEHAMQSRERIRRALNGRPVPSIDRIFHDMRDERDVQLLVDTGGRNGRQSNEEDR